MAREALVIVGCGGLGREVLWAARRAQALTPDWTAELVGFTAEMAPEGGSVVDGLPFLGLLGPDLAAGCRTAPTHYICAIGDNQARKRICARMEALGLRPKSVLDPSVLIAPGVEVGPGTYVGAGSILSPSANLGAHVVVNQGCTIGHDATVGAFAQVCPGARVSGWAIVGEGALLGSNAVVAPKVSVGAWSILAAASMASRDLPAEVTALGTPARIVFRKPLPPVSQEHL